MAPPVPWLTLDRLRTALAAHHPAEPAVGGGAAVAAVVRETPTAVEMLLIHRADDPRDPWSGHMAFPGGRVEASDATPLNAAIRETREEVGIDLTTAAEPVGRLSAVPAIADGSPSGLVIQPFVFALVEPCEPRLGPEVQAVVWVPLPFLADPANRAAMRWSIAGSPVTLPCYRYQGSTLWGLTLRMTDELLRLAAASGAEPGG